MTENKIIRIFMMPQQFPCGPQSSCCGPIGQTREEVLNLEKTIEKETGFLSEVYNVKDEKDMMNYIQITQLIRTFDATALPIITLDDEIVCMGSPTPDQVMSAIREKMAQV